MASKQHDGANLFCGGDADRSQKAEELESLLRLPAGWGITVRISRSGRIGGSSV
ncbi:MAG: hypothetical protein VB075_14025 [Petrimonas sp.]|uniref:hypothetical protein n=1 Tax=Petrimonas sp. TaxID=2023866 RepID=UPI002B3E623E|nr:hypothetical protein [Petrimonas sp.]